MNNFTWILLFIFSFSISAQNIKGKIYNEKSTAKNIGVFNLTTKNYTYTNDEGDFTIEASTKDTLLFSSAFYKPHQLIVADKHFKITNVIELKTQVNTLGTVNLSNTSKFNANKYQTNLSTKIKTDIKKNPKYYKYTDTLNPKGNLMIAINSLFALLKRKDNTEKMNDTPLVPITYKSFYALFNTNSVFTENLLVNDLNIERKNIPLFFDYCDTKKLNDNLLKPENKMILLDSLIKFSRAFKTHIAETDRILIKD